MESDDGDIYYFTYIAIGLILASWHLEGGILILMFYIEHLTNTTLMLFSVSWLAIFLSVMCVLYYVIIPEKEFYVITDEQYKKYLERRR